MVEESPGQADGSGRFVARIVFVLALCWSLFQIWIASPLPYVLGFAVFTETQSRSIHLAFALVLAYLVHPAASRRHGSPVAGWCSFTAAVAVLAYAAALYLGLVDGVRPGLLVLTGVALAGVALAAMREQNGRPVPAIDWLLAVTAALTALYLYLYYEQLAMRPGRPLFMDLAVSGVGLVLLLEATRRALGPALTLIAAVFLLYTFAGPHMPDVLAHRGASFARAASQYWLSGEGVFGIALGVSTNFVFLFVLFGALLDRAGAGNYFIQVAYSLLGHMRGGPAKAAVVASGMTGVVSGSSIANTVTTGTFTIPLMKRVGFRADKAGAVEVASSVNGQLMPPVMGAAAFLMVEYVGISYVEVIRHAILPAAIAYVALLYIVHLEALKAGMQGIPPSTETPRVQRLLTLAFTVLSLLLLAGVIYYGMLWLQPMLGRVTGVFTGLLLLIAYLGLLWNASRFPPLPADRSDEPLTRLPAAKPTINSGLHFVLPIVVLVWALVVERLSPGVAAFWAVMLLVFILLTQRPLLALFRGQRGYLAAAVRGGADLLHGMVMGARNMIAIAVATATAGIVVGTVSMTGVGLVLTQVVEALSGGNLLLILVLVALMSVVLGLGLPTTANYIIVATLMAPVVVELGAEAGLVVPLIAVHLFVFYFGIMADLTPPVGLASYAAAAISRGDPIMTGVHAFWYSLRMVALPFIFIFNTQLLLIGVETVPGLLLIIFSATVAMLVFAAATQGYFVTRTRWYEAAALLLVAFTLLRPGFWMDRIHAPYEHLDAARLTEVVEALPDGGNLRFWVEGDDAEGREVSRAVMLPLPEAETAEERLRLAGISLVEEDGKNRIQDVEYGSPAERARIDYGWRVTRVLVPADRPAPEWFFLPALGLLAGVWWWQRRRLMKP